MSLRGKLAVALLVSLLMVVGALYFIGIGCDGGVPHGTEKSLTEEPPPELPPETPEVEIAAVEPVVEEPTTEQRGGRRLLAKGGWVSTGRVVENSRITKGGGAADLRPVDGGFVYLNAYPLPKDRVDDPIRVHRQPIGRDGRFRFKGVPGEPLQFVIDVQGFAIRTLRVELDKRAEAGAEKNFDDMFLYPSTDVRFHVSDPQGGPALGAKVFPKMSSSDSFHQRIQDAAEGVRLATEEGEGIYLATGMPTGKCNVQVAAEGYAFPKRIYFDSPLPEDEDPFPIVLEVGLPFAGYVFTIDGDPVYDALVDCANSQSRTGEDGHFVVEHVATGNHRV